MSNNSTTKGDLTEWSEFEAARALASIAGIQTKILKNENDDETPNDNNDLKTRNGFDLVLAMSKEEVSDASLIFFRNSIKGTSFNKIRPEFT